MDLNQCAANILNHKYSAYDCRGLAQKDSAETMVKYYFERENISFDGWKVSEIPLVDNSGIYPVAIAICIVNPERRIGISLNFTPAGVLYNCNPDECCEIETATILEAINHPTAMYQVSGNPPIEERLAQLEARVDEIEKLYPVHPEKIREKFIQEQIHGLEYWETRLRATITDPEMLQDALVKNKEQRCLLQSSLQQL